METLTYERYPPLGIVGPTAEVTFRSGREVYLCNPFTELQSAMSAGVPFTAHSVIAMQPSEVVINPEHVALIEVK